MAVARSIGEYKKENNITILQSDRWKVVLEKYIARAQAHDLSEEFLIRFIKAVHDESINQQERIFEEKD
jgi:chorismate mutase